MQYFHVSWEAVDAMDDETFIHYAATARMLAEREREQIISEVQKSVAASLR